MKKLLLILFLAINIEQIVACDFCNCYLGLNPHYKKNNAGIRYHLMNYNGTHHDNEELAEMGINKNDFWETRSTFEVHGQWYPVQKLQLLFSLPYLYNLEGLNSQEGNMVNEHHHGSTATDVNPIKGIGDPLFLAHYQLFNKVALDSGAFSHRLMAGAGIKFPLGNWELKEEAEPTERVHLPGTGSWDYITSVIYLVKFNRIGFNINFSYLFTTTNNESFRYGNRFNANIVMYYPINKKNFSLYPNMGIYYEEANKDHVAANLLDNSGGKITYGHAGFDIYYKKFSLNAAGQFPVVQSLNENQPHLQYRIITGVSFALN